MKGHEGRLHVHESTAPVARIERMAALGVLETPPVEELAAAEAAAAGCGGRGG
jgi:hypothetical protein